MSMKMAGNLAIVGGIAITVAILNVWMIVAAILILGGSGARAITNPNRSGVLTRKAKKALL